MRRPPPPPRGSGKIVLAVLAVIALVAGGGGILGYAVSRHHPQASLAPAPRRSASTSAPSSAARASHPAAARASSPAAVRASSPASPAAQPGNNTIAVAPSVSDHPAARSIVNLLTSYFRAVNAHDYLAYRRLLDPQLKVGLTPAQFGVGFGSTVDSGATLTAISAAPSGRAAAEVMFTSHQAPANGPDNNSCTNWTVTLFLEQAAGGYLIGEAPPGYRSSHQRCLAAGGGGLGGRPAAAVSRPVAVASWPAAVVSWPAAPGS